MSDNRFTEEHVALDTKTAQFRTGWAATLAAMIALTFSPSTIAMMGIGVFIRPIQADLGVSRGDVILISTVINSVVVLASPLSGALIDRYGARRVILPSLLIFSIGLASLSIIPPTMNALYIAWAAIIALSAGVLPGGYLKLVSTWFDKRLGLALGVANSGIGLGNILVPLIAGSIIALYDWRTAYLALGAIIVLMSLPICFLFLRENPNTRSAVSQSDRKSISREESRNAFRSALSSPAFWVLVGAYILLGISTAPLAAQQVPLLIDRGLAPQQAAAVQSMFGFFLLVGRFGAGYLLDRVFISHLLIVGAIGASIACLLYAFQVSPDLAVIPAALIGLIVGAEFDVLGYAIKRYFGIPAFGRLYALIFSVFQIGAALGALIFAIGQNNFGSYRMGLFVSFGCLVVTALIVLMLPRYPSRGIALEKPSAI